MSREKVVTLQGVDHDSATGKAKDVLDTAKAQVGFVPNMYANMVNLPGVLDTYLHGYKLFREDSGLTPQEQEVIFLAISHENHCEYCMSAHSMLADKQSGLDADTLNALRAGEKAADPKLAALDHFTRIMMKTRGNPDRNSVQQFLAAGYREQDILAIVLAISVKILSNYSNHLFNTEVDSVFADYQWPE